MPGKMKLQYENDSCFHIEKVSGGVRGLMKGVSDGGYGGCRLAGIRLGIGTTADVRDLYGKISAFRNGSDRMK